MTPPALTRADLLIRLATPDDVAAIQALERATPTAPHWPEAAYREAVAGPDSSSRFTLVAVQPPHATVVGFAVASLGAAGESALESVAVSAASQRQGIGRALCLAVAAHASTQGAAELLLEVRAGSQPAVMLYRSLGFVEIGRRPGYYSHPTDDALVMRLHLAPTHKSPQRP